MLLKAAAIQPVAEAHKWIGQIYLHNGDIQRAIVHFEKARGLGDRDPRLINALRKAYIKTGQQAKAEVLTPLKNISNDAGK